MSDAESLRPKRREGSLMALIDRERVVDCRFRFNIPSSIPTVRFATTLSFKGDVERRSRSPGEMDDEFAEDPDHSGVEEVEVTPGAGSIRSLSPEQQEHASPMNGTPSRDSDATRNSTTETESGIDPKAEEVISIISGVDVIDIDSTSRNQVTHSQSEHRGESLQPVTCDSIPY